LQPTGLASQTLLTSEMTARFIIEARATAQFQDENIVVIHEVGEHEGLPFMVLEYLEGAPLSELLKDGRGVSPRQATQIMLSVARALERAHSRSIVHRDLKPDNIFITDTGVVKVLDFGIAKLAQGPEVPQAAPKLISTELRRSGMVPKGKDLTEQGILVGTLSYMSPEQWGVAPIDHLTDIWAVGIILFRMVTGQHPLAPRQGPQLVVTALLSEPMPRVRDIRPEVPEELAAIIDHCLMKPKDKRMPSARALREALEALTPGLASQQFALDKPPYAGLSSFQESDAARFFGRTKEVAAALNRLQTRPLLAILGPSGVGKSSFVRAGVVPALKQSGQRWSALVLRPGRDALAALAATVAAAVQDDSSSGIADALKELRSIQERLAQEPGFVATVLRQRARRTGQHILLFVDQFEELYTLSHEPETRRLFTQCLTSIADDATSPLRVVVSMRSDFLDRVAEDEALLRELSQGLFFLQPPDRQGLREAILQPAEMAGYQFEDETIVEQMVNHLENSPAALPLLQFAATQLWELRDRKRRLLTEASYQAIGGIGGALATHADAVLLQLAPLHQGLARAILLRLVTPERTRAIVSLSELAELAPHAREVQQVLDHLVAARLLVVHAAEDNRQASAEIVHESLLVGWPRLQRWLEETQEDAAFLEQLRQAARQWQARNYAAGLLWRGEAMQEAKLWHSRYQGTLPTLQQRYLDAVFALSQRSKRLRQVALGAFVILMTALLAVGSVVLVVVQEARQRATQKAHAAQRAEQRVRQQFAIVKQANAEAIAARQRASEARQVVERINHELSDNNEKLLVASEMAKQASLRAKRKELDARNAESRVREANTTLQTMLEKERLRAEQLEKQGVVSVVPDVEVTE